MPIIALMQKYFLWHYGRAYLDIWGIWKNFLWFFYNFFSIPELTRTLFDKWRKIGEERKRGLDMNDLLSVFFINMIMRLIGFILKATLIMIGLIALLITFVLGLAFIVLWAFIPFAVIVGFFTGFNFIFS